MSTSCTSSQPDPADTGTRANISYAATQPAIGPTTAAVERLSIVVMIHHPGYGDPEGRSADMVLIIAELRRNEIGFESWGGLGRGYQVAISTDDLHNWKRIIDRLMQEKALRAYSTWGLDEHGHGLITISKY